MSDKETLSVYDARAEDYATHFGKETASPALKNFMTTVLSGGHVLDLGCGPGDSAALLVQHGFDVDAIDASEGMVQQANTRFDVGARVATFDDVTAEGIYDGVWANFSLLHAEKSDFPRYLRAIHTALKPNGVFHIGTKLKTDTDAGRDKIGRFYSYYDEGELLTHLSEAGFSVLSRHKGHEVGLSGSDDPFILVLCRA